MKNHLLISFFLIISTTIFSQNKSDNNWIFGEGLWLDFNNEPVSLGGTPMNGFASYRNNVSVSDITGNLLFYGNEAQIYNQEHAPMANGSGLILDFSNSSNPIYSIPKPNSINGYYILTTDPYASTPGLYWSEIDMTLDNGLGDINDNKNILLSNSCTGKITAVRHANLIDIWIVSHRWGGNTFEAWLVTENGISTTPVVSEIGQLIFDDSNINGWGQMKTSPDGSQIACAHYYPNTTEVFDFDSNTGMLSNSKFLHGFFRPFGVEFSPNGRYLYISQSGSFQVNGLVQLDLLAGDESAIIDSKVVLGLTDVSTAGGLQLAPDGKIYSVNDIFVPELGIINNPNEPGSNCEFEEDGITAYGNEYNMGFPSFMHDAYQPSYLSITSKCFGAITDFEIAGFPYTIDSVLWNFDDPSATNNSSNEFSSSHEFSSPGFFSPQVTIYFNGQEVTFVEEVLIFSSNLDLISDQEICDNETYLADAYIPGATYLWSNNDSLSSIEISAQGEYWVQVNFDNCGVLTDTFNIVEKPTPDVDIGGVIQDCPGTIKILDATDPNPDANYIWDTGETSPSIQIELSTFHIYRVTVTYPNGCTDGDITLVNPIHLEIDANHANLSCFENESGVAVALPDDSSNPPFSFLWNTGDTTYTINQLSAGTYTLTLTDDIGCTLVEEYEISQPPPLTTSLVVNIDDPLTTIPDGSVFINPSGGTPPYTIEWDAFGELLDPVYNLETGVYNITLTDDNDCEVELEVVVGDGTTNVNEIPFFEKIEIYPNPFLEKITIESEIKETVLIELFDVFGKKIKSETVSFFDGKYEFVLSGLNAGVYFITIADLENQFKFSKRLVKVE